MGGWRGRPVWEACGSEGLTVAVGEQPVLLAAGRGVRGQARDRPAEHLLVRRLQGKGTAVSRAAGAGSARTPPRTPRRRRQGPARHAARTQAKRNRTGLRVGPGACQVLGCHGGLVGAVSRRPPWGGGLSRPVSGSLVPGPHVRYAVTHTGGRRPCPLQGGASVLATAGHVTDLGDRFMTGESLGQGAQSGPVRESRRKPLLCSRIRGTWGRFFRAASGPVGVTWTNVGG